MKNIVKNKVKDIFQKYKYNTVLTLIIFILFLIFGYSKSNINYKVFVNEKQVQFAHGIYELNSEQYIHVDDLTSFFGENIYNDKISGKLIITTYDKLEKINKNDDRYVVKENDNIYFNLKKIISQIGRSVIVSKDNIHILDANVIEGIVKNNRTELYDNLNNSVICLLEKQDRVKVYVDEHIKDETQNIVNVEVTINGKTYYGYVLKKHIAYEYKDENVQVSNKKMILVKADNKLMASTDTKYVDMVTINMYRLSGVNTLAKLEYTNNVEKTIDVFATINNGQKSSNYDMDIVTGMLNSESNRDVVIQQITEGVKNISGVNLDFSNFKASDKEKYTQFVKELAAVMHKNNKKIIVNIPSTQYVEIEKISKIVDYIVLQPYSARTLSSKTSGPISSITYVEQSVQDVITKQVDLDKVILELPTHTILWTERRGTVINAEQYNMKTAQAYLKANDIKPSIDSVSGQNYINYTKGITTYKMWLEDEYSLTQKANIANIYNLAGVSIYRSGMEQKEIYNSISKCLEK